MDQNLGSSPLFGLSIDQNSRNHLAEAARWAKFLAIVGFVVCGLIVLTGIFFSSIFATMTPYDRGYETERDAFGAVGATMAFFYVIIAVLYFFPCLFLYYFATKMKAALLSNNQDILNASFQNLKKMLRYVGIVTIVFLAFYGLVLAVAIIGAAASGV